MTTGLLAFFITLVFALIFHWEARDLVWGLWISSLSVGYLFIVKAIVSGILLRDSKIPLGAALGAGMFLILFFTFHFGMFHFVHSVFLNLFFPLFPASKKDMPNAPLFIVTALKWYWPVVLANFIVKWPDFKTASFDRSQSKDVFMKPYSSVVKMHLLIFVFAGMAAFHLDRFALYPVLFFYFFPWEVLKK